MRFGREIHCARMIIKGMKSILRLFGKYGDLLYVFVFSELSWKAGSLTSGLGIEIPKSFHKKAGTPADLHRVYVTPL